MNFDNRSRVVRTICYHNIFGIILFLLLLLFIIIITITTITIPTRAQFVAFIFARAAVTTAAAAVVAPSALGDDGV